MPRKKKSKGVLHTAQYPVAGSSRQRGEYLCIIGIFLAGSVLVLANLGNIYLWGDEAATALVSKTILTYGIPMGAEHGNCFCQMYGKEVNQHGVWIWHPWFPFYLVAVFFRIFGISTLTARLPFALIGIGVVMMNYFYGKLLWHSKRAGVLAATLLLVSVPFLLLVRQCRYYSPAIFFSISGLYAYSQMLKGRRLAPAVLGLSACLLFHTHYVYAATLLATVIVHSAIYRRDLLRTAILVSALVTAICIPWMILFAGMGHTMTEFGSFSARVSLNMERFGLHIVRHMFTPVLFIVLAVLAGFWNSRRRGRPWKMDPETAQSLALLVIYILVTIVTLGLTAQTFFFRYLAPLIPVFCLISALILESSMKLHPAIALAAMVVLAWRGQMPDYLYEITHDYDGPNEGIVKYLNAHAKRGDVVAVNHENLPIMFYTDLRVICAVSGEDCSSARNAQWIVLRRFYVTKAELDMTRLLVHNMGESRYERFTLNYPDTPFENREDPERHFFRTQESEPRVTIYRRTEE